MKKIPLYFGLLLAFGIYTQTISALTINPNPQLDGDTSVSTDINLSQDNSLGGSDANLNVNSSSTGPINSNTSAEIKESIKVEREDMDDSSETVLINAESVNTNADLLIYAKSLVLSDINVEEVSFEKDEVNLGYEKEGKILGLFKIKYDIETKVNSDGKIEVDYPWYAVLTSGNQKIQVRERMEKEVSEFLDRNTNASGEIELNASVEARLANLIHTILVEELAGGVSVGTSENTSSDVNNRYMNDGQYEIDNSGRDSTDDKNETR